MGGQYAGPLRQEPIAIELHNTLFAVNGQLLDGIEDGAPTAAWLDGLATRLPDGGGLPSAADLVELRGAVRDALHSAVDGESPSRMALEAINQAAARAPRSVVAIWRPDADPIAATDHHGAGAGDIVIAALAADAIELLTGPRRADLRSCGAPGCVLMFLKDHPRREWCSNTCGNRARQARHYERTHRRDPA